MYTMRACVRVTHVGGSIRNGLLDPYKGSDELPIQVDRGRNPSDLSAVFPG